MQAAEAGAGTTWFQGSSASPDHGKAQRGYEELWRRNHKAEHLGNFEDTIKQGAEQLQRGSPGRKDDMETAEAT